MACYSTVVLTVVAENAAGASEPSEPFERTPERLLARSHARAHDRSALVESDTGAEPLARSIYGDAIGQATAQPTLSSGSRSSGSDGAIFVVVAAVIGAVSAILLACFLASSGERNGLLASLQWARRRRRRRRQAPAPAPACGTAEDVFADTTCFRIAHAGGTRAAGASLHHHRARGTRATGARGTCTTGVAILARLAKCAGIYATGARGTRATAARGSPRAGARMRNAGERAFTRPRFWLAWRRRARDSARRRRRRATRAIAEIAAGGERARESGSPAKRARTRGARRRSLAKARADAWLPRRAL